MAHTLEPGPPGRCPGGGRSGVGLRPSPGSERGNSPPRSACASRRQRPGRDYGPQVVGGTPQARRRAGLRGRAQAPSLRRGRGTTLAWPETARTARADFTSSLLSRYRARTRGQVSSASLRRGLVIPVPGTGALVTLHFASDRTRACARVGVAYGSASARERAIARPEDGRRGRRRRASSCSRHRAAQNHAGATYPERTRGPGGPRAGSTT